MPQNQTFVGIDISRARLDVHVHPSGEAFSLPYDRKGIARLLARRDLAGAVLGCEASGGYEERLLVALTEAGRPAYCLHPADVRAFARLKGRRAKTDRLDARAIAEALPTAAGARVPLRRTRAQSELRELLGVRRALMAAALALKGHLSRVACAEARAALRALLTAHQRRIAALERAIRARVDAEPAARRIRSAPGAGLLLAGGILAFLPELGQLSSRQAASLAGVAPHPRQSGRSHRPGRCQGGRSTLRRVLYMATLSAVRANLAPLAPFYRHLRANGKPAKLALVATMRKFIVMLNAMLKTETDWRPQAI